jgi:exonuclease III
MKIATFNINNINRRLPNLLAWLRVTKPDIVCLQELKATDAEFPADEIGKAGYQAVWRGQRTWNGVVLYRGGGIRNPGGVHLSTERQPAAWTEIRLQACVVQTPCRSRA